MILANFFKRLKDGYFLAHWAATYNQLEVPINFRDILIKSVINPIRSVIKNRNPIIPKLKRLAILYTRYNDSKPFIRKQVLSTNFDFLSKLETEEIYQLIKTLAEHNYSHFKRIINAKQINYIIITEILDLYQKRIIAIA